MELFKKIKNKFKQIEWKIYFFIFVFVYIRKYFWIDISSYLSLLKWIIFIAITVGFFGLAWKQRIFSQFFWKLIFILIIPWQIGSLVAFLSSSDLWAGLIYFHISTIGIIVAIIFLKIIPLCALYFYAFKSENIWKKINKKITFSLLIIAGVLVIAGLVIISSWQKHNEAIQKFNVSPCFDSLDIHCKIRNDYMAEYAQEANFGGRVFCAHTVMGSDQVEEIVTEYLWATCGEFFVENGELEDGSGSSLPVVLTIKNTTDSYRVIKHEVPGVGSDYLIDIERMFPKYILKRGLFFAPSIFDRVRTNVGVLLDEEERKARIHFGLE